MEQEYIPLMQNLIRHTLRKFYDPCHCVIMDILLEHFLLKESELCSHMKILGKEFNKLIIKLREDKLIRQESKIETTVDNRSLLSQCYFLDFREIKEIIKYKTYKMSQNISKKNVNDSLLLICKNCDLKVSSLEAQSNMRNFKFICKNCDNFLEEDKNENDYFLHNILMKDLKEIIEMLKKADSFDIPSMDYFQVLELKKRFFKKDQEENNLQSNISQEKEIQFNNSDQNNFNNQEIQVQENNKDFEQEEIIFDKENKILENKNIENDYFCKVNKVEKKFSEITEEDQEKMTESEYEEYFEIYNKINE